MSLISRASDLVERKRRRRTDGDQKRRGVNDAQPRPRDDHGAGEADSDREPAAQPHRLAQDQCAQHCDHEGRDEADGHGVGQRHEADRRDEQHRRQDDKHAAQQLQLRPARAQDRQARARPDDHGDGDEHAEVARPGDLQHGQVLTQVLGLGVDEGEQDRGQQHEGDAAPSVVAPYERRHR